MTIEEMHYSFKVKMNKVDSQSQHNFLIPEIDFILNEAAEIFVKLVAQPRYQNSPLGFETTERTIEDIRPLIVPVELSVVNNKATLPNSEDGKFWFFLRGRATMRKGNCEREGVLYQRQHDDLFEESSFDKTSFEWKTVNALFNKDGIQLFAKDFTITKLSIDYIKQLSYMHNAQKFTGGKYKKPDGVTILEGKKDCELPPYTHQEIVDIAVMLASGNLIPDFNIKRDKVNNINQIS